MDFNTGAMRSPFSPRVRQSLPGRRPAKKNPSNHNQSEDLGGDVIYKTPSMTLETFGAPLPVMVTEALTFATSDVSVRLSSCGWCWLVVGRRLLAWPGDALAWPGDALAWPGDALAWPGDAPVAASTGASSASSSARELTLPQTDLAHKADLVMLFYEDGAQMPSCIGVSPEGIVRYWASVGQEGAYVDVSCELAGQECDRIVSTQSKAPLVLATTTCTLVLLTPSTVDGRATVTCRTLRPPSGWLGGIGRRVSVMFFGSMPAHVDTRPAGVAVVGAGGLGGADGCVALVAGPLLQLWRGAALHEHSLRAALRAALPGARAEPGAPRAVRARGAALLLLLPPYVAQLCVAEPAAPAVTRLLLLRGAAPEDPRAGLLPLPAHVLVFGRARAALHACEWRARAEPAGAAPEPEVLDLAAEGDRLLAGELCGGGAVLFSLRHGLLRLKPQAQAHRSVCESEMSSPCPSDMYEGNLSLYEIDPLEVSSATLDLCGKLKTAFLFHVRRDTARCRDLLRELFPAAAPPPAAVDDALDRTVLRIARDMLDDMPQGDPRWAGGGGALALARSTALHASAQLEDKRRALDLFLEFLQAAGLLARLRSLTCEGGVVGSRAALCWLVQQLALARTLRARAGCALTERAVQHVAARAAPEEEPETAAALRSGALAPADVVYRRASRAHRVLAALAALDAAPARVLPVAQAALEAMLRATPAWARPLEPPPASARALLAALAALVAAAARAEPAPADLPERAAAAADALLRLAAPLAADRGTRALHDALRADLIRPFVETGQLERGAALAERHGALGLLVEACVRAADWPRLRRYLSAHEHEGIAELAFSQLAALGGRGARALAGELGPGSAGRLRAWLAARGAAGGALEALHALAAGDGARAADALARLAEREARSVRRAASAAALARLCLRAAAAPAAELDARLRRRVALCAAHGAMPRALRLRHALDAPDCRPHAAAHLVRMYADGAGAGLTEYDYKAALDLADLVDDADLRDELRLRVWCASVLADRWDAPEVDAPREEMSRRCFFRLLDLVHVCGGDLELVLPALEDVLTAPELADLVEDPRVHFLLKCGYEAVRAPRPAASAN